jgi:hypothetical protein
MKKRHSLITTTTAGAATIEKTATITEIITTTTMKTEGMMIHGTTTTNRIEIYLGSSEAVDGRNRPRIENSVISPSSSIRVGQNTGRRLHHPTSS